MAKEPDQTRWRGIRPTEPPENIPVTESAPLTAIQVEPKPGSADFPIDIKVVSQIVPVAQGPGTPDFKTATEKRAPAIADMQAIKEVILTTDTFTVTVPGINNRLVYEVPAGHIGMMVAMSAMSSHANPTSVFAIISRGASNYYLGVKPYGAGWTIEVFQVSCPAAAGDKFELRWMNCTANDILYSSFVGYIIPLYT